jgi:hypothetical protein
MLLDEISELQEQALPFKRFDLAPRTFEGAAGGGNRAVDVLRVAFGHGRQHLAGRGIERLELLARGRIDPLAVDQHLLVGTIGVRMARDRNCLCNSHCVSSSFPDRLRILRRRYSRRFRHSIMTAHDRKATGPIRLTMSVMQKYRNPRGG